jgi:hypothetical protein
MSFTLRRLFLATIIATLALGFGLNWAGPEGAASSAVGALALGGLVLWTRPAYLPGAIGAAFLAGVGLWAGWNSVYRGDVDDRLTVGAYGAVMGWFAFQAGRWVLRWVFLELRDGPHSLCNSVRRRLEAQHQARRAQSSQDGHTE